MDAAVKLPTGETIAYLDEAWSIVPGGDPERRADLQIAALQVASFMPVNAQAEEIAARTGGEVILREPEPDGSAPAHDRTD